MYHFHENEFLKLFPNYEKNPLIIKSDNGYLKSILQTVKMDVNETLFQDLKRQLFANR